MNGRKLDRRSLLRSGAVGAASIPALGALHTFVIGQSSASAGSVALLQDPAGTLTIAQDSSFAVLDAAGAGKVRAEPEIVRHLYNNLVRFEVDMTVVPDLAESWTVSDDGTVWTFILRSGVKFHDGTDFDAEAVKFSYDRLLDEEFAFQNRGVYAAFLQEVRVVDATRVEIVTQGPFGPTLNFLAFFGGGIVSPTAVEAAGSDFGTQPVGTGPYRAEEVIPGDQATLVRNPDYFGEPALTETLVFRTIVEEGARTAALESGQVDIATGLPAQDVQRLSEAGFTVVSAPSLQAQYLGINTTRPNLDNVNVRHAINYAIDKQALVESVFLGTFTEADSVLTPGTFGYQPQTPYGYDPTRASELLSEAGFGPDNPLELVLWSPQGLYPKDIVVAQAIQSMLGDVGIEVAIEQKESASYFTDLKVPASEAGYDLYMWAFVPSTGDGYQTMLNNLLSNEEDIPATFNFSRYSNPEFDALVLESRDETEQETRRAALEQAQVIAWNDAPLASLYVIAIVNGYGEGVTGVEALPTRYLDLTKATKS